MGDGGRHAHRKDPLPAFFELSMLGKAGLKKKKKKTICEDRHEKGRTGAVSRSYSKITAFYSILPWWQVPIRLHWSFAAQRLLEHPCVWNATVLKRKASEDITVFISDMFSHGQNAHSATGLFMCAQGVFLERGKVLFLPSSGVLMSPQQTSSILNPVCLSSGTMSLVIFCP